jgi:hypothetical protein
MATEPNRPMLDEPPPILGRWWRVYVAVLVYLGGLIYVFWLFARKYAP